MHLMHTLDITTTVSLARFKSHTRSLTGRCLKKKMQKMNLDIYFDLAL